MKIYYLVKKEIIEILRQKQMIFMILVSPLIQILIFGYIANTDIKNLSVEIINISSNKYAGKIINRVEKSGLFIVKKISGRYENPIEKLKAGKIKAAIIFRDSFDKKKNPTNFPEIQILSDGVNSNSSLIAAGYFNGIISDYLLKELKAYNYKPIVIGKTIIRYNPGLKSINYMGPAIVAMLLTVITIFLASSSLVREKEQQTIDTLLISRLKPIEIYLGKAIPVLFIGLIDMFLGVGFVILWFGIQIKGSLFQLFIVSIIYLIALLSLALFISTITKTQQEALFFSWFIMITFILLSGIFTPIENMPRGLRLLTKANPLRYLMKIIREIFLKGNGLRFFYNDIFSLIIISGIMIGVSLSIFKKKISA